MHNSKLLYSEIDYDEFFVRSDEEDRNEDGQLLRAGVFVFSLDHCLCEEDAKVGGHSFDSGSRCRKYWQAVFHFDVDVIED
jgi:hypothetical protein